MLGLLSGARPTSAEVPVRDENRSWVGTPVLRAGTSELAVVHELSITSRALWPADVVDASRLGVDLAVAVDRRLTLGLSHSARAVGTVDRGGGWCHAGQSGWCRRAYAGGLVDARWHLHRAGDLVLAALGRIGVVGVGPLRPVVRLGLSTRWARQRWWAVVEPEMQISLGHRELGNRDTLVAPIWIGWGQRRAAAWLQTGLRGQMVGFRDKLEIPLVLGAAVRRWRTRVGVELGWPALAGPRNTAAVHHASMWIAAEI